MPKRREATSPMNEISVLTRRIHALEQQVARMMQTGPASIQRGDLDRYPDPAPGELMLNAPQLTPTEIEEEEEGILRRQQWMVHRHDERWHSFGDFVVIVYDNEDTVEIGTDIVSWPASRDLDGVKLQRAEAHVHVPGGVVTVDVKNLDGAGSMLIDPITINAGDKHSHANTPISGVSMSANQVNWMDEISIDVIAGGGALGLKVALGFS